MLVILFMIERTVNVVMRMMGVWNPDMMDALVL